MRIPIKQLNISKDMPLRIGGTVKSSVHVGTTANDAKSIEYDTDLQLFIIVPVKSHTPGEVLIAKLGAGYTTQESLEALTKPATVKPGAK